MRSNPREQLDAEAKRNTVNRREGILVVVMVILLALTIGIVVWQTVMLESNSRNIQQPTPQPSTNVTWPQVIANMVIYKNLTTEIHNGTKQKFYANLQQQNGSHGINPENCSTRMNDYELCLIWPTNTKLTINFSRSSLGDHRTDLDCYDIKWHALQCTDQVFTDCFSVSSAHWYGGYADKIQNWPFEKNTRKLSAYVVNDSYVGEIGGVVERYFFSSEGIAIFVEHSIPLYFSLNSPEVGRMCLTSKFDKYPYFNMGSVLPTLQYKICDASNVKDIHLKMSSAFISRPKGIPDENLFKYPIWSTWAQYKKDINQTTVLEFAGNIQENNFTHAQLEIDDDWTLSYGDMLFNAAKFPNATEMIKILNNKGFRVTVWVHPFFNIDSKSFQEAALNMRLIRQFEQLIPAMIPWWDGHLAGILDVSNSSAVNWFLSKLQHLKTVYNISSFKFDAGETSWLPHIYSAANMSLNPTEIYPMKWVELAALADPTFHQEVRVGYRTQIYPIFIRMMDKESNWGHNNALKTIIPCVLTYGLLGYPFVLPDMIGGNAYDNHPDPELYVRWLQLNTFLPSMQYSIVPWMYNDTIIEIAHKYTKLHENVSDTLIKYAKRASATGEPIIRPLWWIDPEDEVALTCEDEFLVGDEFLVAPVLEEGSRSRDIYFPKGLWVDQLHNASRIFQGPRWEKNYPVEIDELAYFIQKMT